MAAAANEVLSAAGTPPPADAEAISAAARRHASAIVLLQPVGDRVIYLWASPDGKLEIRRSAPLLDEIRKLTTGVAQSLHINSVRRGGGEAVVPEPKSRVDNAISQLSRLLIDPMEEFLGGDAPLIVSPYREAMARADRDIEPV